jgi:hypothetical protein
MEARFRVENEQLCALMMELADLAFQLRQSATEMRQILAARKRVRVLEPAASGMEN